jgi:hypothetical protein
MIATKEFLKVCDYRNLEKAAKIARKNKPHIAGRWEFFSNFEENIITLQNELIWRLYFPKMPVPDFRDIVVQIALFNSLSHDCDLLKDLYVFALLENIVFSKIVQSPKKMIRSLDPFRIVYRRRGRHRKRLKP